MNSPLGPQVNVPWLGPEPITSSCRASRHPVGVVEQDAGLKRVERGIVGHGVRIVVRDRGGFGDGDRDGGLVALGAAVGSEVGEGVGAEVVSRRGIGERAVGIERDRTAAQGGDRRLGYGREGQAGGVGVVEQHAGGRDRQRMVVHDGVCVVVGSGSPWVTPMNTVATLLTSMPSLAW